MGPTEVVFLFLPIGLLALIPAKIAERKGHAIFPYWLFGVFLWPVALLFALLEKDRRRRCPHCIEPVHPSAVVCPHCQRDIGVAAATA